MTSSDPDTAREALQAAIARLAGGDRAALEEIYHATSRKLFGICLRILRDEREAEDALQEVYLDFWKRADRYDPARASPISWLACMARNRAVDRLRAGGKVRKGAVPEEAACDVADEDMPADERLLLDERDARIHHCLGTLEARQQSAIRRAFLGGATYVQLAEADGVALSTVKSRVHRGLAKLKKCIERL
ncbi:sigma-70 family RNA polymerase sigma factor [Aurantiacibacter aquimixticola]|uniref:Sigma-70 family RNA polymerase sigma factor n=1 Tax=Aurantiacibacter aquimixticola TaxID=1958945 RepID=A0A419RTH4_9SPHN|nr:sigma-70 family RNA polymerase sigma factor [Aurantiacibacter aquimixticola]RJY09093.1 sigma-70 family RNA polymerase sigma factor [Aurantiacibacter aquimixticola]